MSCNKHPVTAFILLGFAFALLLGASARGEFWLDEISSIAISNASDSLLDIFVRFHHDNNHVLNTLFLYVLGDPDTFFSARLLSLASGLGTLLLMALIASRRWGTNHALLTMLLVVFSYPLVLYFSEARGYGPAMLFTMLAYLALGGDKTDGGKGTRLALYWAASFLGILSHLSFLMFSAAAAVLTTLEATRRPGRFEHAFSRPLVVHASVLLLGTGWYWFFTHDMTIGGGPILEKSIVVKEAARLLLGIPDLDTGVMPATLIVTALCLASAFLLRRERSAEWSFCIILIIVLPFVLVFVIQPEHFYVRYLIICFPFFYLFVSHLIVVSYRSASPLGRLCIVATVAVAIVVQFGRMSDLVRFGRGNYIAVLKTVVGESDEPTVRIGSNHDFRNQMMFNYYAPLVDPDERLKYVTRESLVPEPPDWFITHDTERLPKPLNRLSIPGVGTYTLVMQSRFSGHSGWNTYLYRR